MFPPHDPRKLKLRVAMLIEPFIFVFIKFGATDNRHQNMSDFQDDCTSQERRKIKNMLIMLQLNIPYNGSSHKIPSCFERSPKFCPP